MSWTENFVLLFLAVLLGLALWPKFQDVLQAVQEALDNFRGGPPTPMHPSPADVRALLTCRRSPKR